MDKNTENQTITMDDIARLSGVSKPTVSRALANSPLVKEHTREKVLKIAREYGYAVNRNAQKLRSKRTNTVAVMLDFPSHSQSRIRDPFVFELLAGISEALSVREHDLLLRLQNLQHVNEYKDMIQSKSVDGFVFLGQGTRDSLLIKLAKAQIPFVVWGAARKHAQYCTVGSDNYAGGRLAAEHLISKGCKKILFVGDTTHVELRQRRNGLHDRCNDEHSAPLVVDLPISDFSYDASYSGAVEYIGRTNELPDGIFAYSDTAAMAFIVAMREANIGIPEDLHLVGYNDSPASEQFYPALTTIGQDIYLAGNLLVEKLIQLLDGAKPKSSVLPTKLIVRKT